MKTEKNKPSEEESDGDVKLLEPLKKKLYSDNISTARHAAFRLSWMQEDGFEILKEVLFGDTSRRTKTAATYGLRSMRGRMKQMALELLDEGIEHQDRDVRDICNHAMAVIKQNEEARAVARGDIQPRRMEIREVRPRGRGKIKIRNHNRKNGNR